jgi:hypothetical protein
MWSAGCRSTYSGFLGRLRFAFKPFVIVGESNQHKLDNLQSVIFKMIIITDHHHHHPITTIITTIITITPSSSTIPSSSSLPPPSLTLEVQYYQVPILPTPST